MSQSGRASRGVLLVGNFLSASTGRPTGGEELAARLTATGWDVTTTSARPRQLIRLVDMMRAVWRHRRRYAVAHVDVFSGRAFVYAEMVGALLRLLRKPFVLTLHGGDLPNFSRHWPRRVRRLLQPAAAVTAPSRYLLDAMRLYRSDVRLVPNAVDLGRYPYRVRERPRPEMLWLRAFHGIYNPTLAAAVVSHLARDFPGVALTMVGADKGDGSLQRTHLAAAAHGVTGRLKLLGAVEKADVPRFMGGADVFLNTSNVDNSPVSLLEAMASGLCIVSTSVGGIPYLLEHERQGLLVPANDAAAMAAAVHRVLTEPGLASRLSRNARAKAQQFDWTSIVPTWDALLRWAAGSPSS